MSIAKKIFFIIFIIILGGLGGIFADRMLFPYLSTTKLFERCTFLKRFSEGITVINKTEQIFVKEETSITAISGKVSTSIVNIVSFENGVSQKNIRYKNGTGIIVTSDGMIMTYSDALIMENSKYKVTVFDGKTYDAEIKSIDSFSNLVFLKINSNNLPVISFANSDDEKAGEKIIAVGNGMEIYQNNYSSGLLKSFNPVYNLSGKTVSSSEKMEGIFEIDSIIDRRFVGGPVVDYMGQTVGIIGSIDKSNSIDYFIIPANKIKKIVDKAIRDELSNNPYLGIYYLPLTKNLSSFMNLSIEKGALVYSASGQSGLSVISGSPAQKAGITINDVILKVNGEEISIDKSLSDIIYKYKKGDKIKFLVLRQDKEIEIEVQL